MNENYKATIVKISNLRKHNNADKLQCANIFGNNVVVGLDVNVGDLGIFFPVECCLSSNFMYENNLSVKPELNKDQKSKGYFGNHGRVKAQTFRGEKSMGFWLPISCLDYLKIPKDILVERYELNSYKDIKICSKYIPKTNSELKNKIKNSKNPQIKKESRIIPGFFKFHNDTPQLGKNIHNINPNDLISISWKMHGTSAIAASIPVKRKLSVVEKIAKLFGAKIKDYKYENIYASRRVIKNEFENCKKEGYYKYDLWSEIGKQLFWSRLYYGESIYYEIVGYTKDGSEIQKGFDYGCIPPLPGEYPEVGINFKAYVYRITRANESGNVVDLDWVQLKERCKELDVEYCPELYYGKAKDLLLTVVDDLNNEDLKIWRETLFQMIQNLYVCDQNSIFCNNKVPEEGIVLRKEGLYLESYKLKSFKFLEYESKQLDKNIIDMETSQNIDNNDNI